LPLDGLRLGRQSAREAASLVDAGTGVSSMTEDMTHSWQLPLNAVTISTGSGKGR
jgi:hypothetical protein